MFLSCTELYLNENIGHKKEQLKIVVVKEKELRQLSVIVADVSNFFDNLDHSKLLKQWKKVLRVMKGINGDDSIKRQSRRIWTKFHELKEETYQEIGRYLDVRFK